MRNWTPLGPIAIMFINDILSTYQSRATQIFESNFNSGAKWSLSTKAYYIENEKEILSEFPCLLISWSKVWGEVSTVCVVINRSHAVTEECRRKFSRKVNGLYPGKAKVLWREVESEEGQRGDSWHHWCAFRDRTELWVYRVASSTLRDFHPCPDS